MVLLHSVHRLFSEASSLFPWIPRALWLVLSCLSLSAQVSPSVIVPSNEGKARVVTVYDGAATRTFVPQLATIESMVERGLQQLWLVADSRAGWRSLISPSDVVGIRIHSSTGKTSGSRPEVVAALAKSLIRSGHPAHQIIVWDRKLASLRAAGYLSLRDSLGIQVRGARDLGYDGDTSYESSLNGTMIWGDHEFGEKGEGRGRRSFVSTLLTQEITKIINLTPLMNHNHAGVNGNLVGLALASVDNTIRFQGNAERLAVAIPEINAVPEIGDRVILNMVDALIAQYQGQTQGRLQDSVVLNELRFSKDPVALDVLSIAELEKQRISKGIEGTYLNRTLYENASILQLGISDPDLITIESLR